MRQRLQRVAAAFCLTAAVCTAVGCVDASAVKRFAAVSAEAGERLETVANDLPAACDRQQALRMEPVADYREPPRRLPSILRQMGPNYLRNAWSVWRSRR